YLDYSIEFLHQHSLTKSQSFAFLSIVKSQSAVKSTLWLFYEDNSMETAGVEPASKHIDT
ncbi:hypothetical protein, partial [Enterococcus avium]|uniref:hypothetical protein n=1 Tax=Enterococcus avium TaxID=33945 RepID=UPI001C709B60